MTSARAHAALTRSTSTSAFQPATSALPIGQNRLPATKAGTSVPARGCSPANGRDGRARLSTVELALFSLLLPLGRPHWFLDRAGLS